MYVVHECPFSLFLRYDKNNYINLNHHLICSVSQPKRLRDYYQNILISHAELEVAVNKESAKPFLMFQEKLKVFSPFQEGFCFHTAPWCYVKHMTMLLHSYLIINHWSQEFNASQIPIPPPSPHSCKYLPPPPRPFTTLTINITQQNCA